MLFILALRGLSSPETSRQGNFFGICGMAVAISVTFLSFDILLSGFIFIMCALLTGGAIGAFVAYRISMTAMPQLIAGFHSLVGLAAVLVALSVFYNPEAFELGEANNIEAVLSNFPNDTLVSEFVKCSNGAGLVETLYKMYELLLTFNQSIIKD